MKAKNKEEIWGHLHWLTVLAQQGSYTAAAAYLNVTKGAVSQRIADLERAAGVPLVQRTTRSVRLTDAGQRLVEEVGAPFEQIARSFAGVRDTAGEPRGVLRVTAPVAFSRQQLVPRLAGFFERYPDIRLELELSDKLRALALEGFDLAIRHTMAPPDTHVAWALCPTRNVLVASRAYLRRRGHPATPADLAGHDCLYYPRTREIPAWHFVEARPGAGQARPRVTVPVSGPFCATNSEALRDAALAGLGIALVPDFTAQSALQGNKLVEVLDEWLPVGAFPDQIFAIRPYAAHVPRAVSVFVEWLRTALQGGFAPAARVRREA
ncbi:LysR family transcriptional regulator [Cupriavidus sp. USMAHM13]|uniref:LysR family transcriptional regulator n=1 Tax=Cupriavidus sp. USMAHM13 TaxID=1389192 RepID=UPI0008A6D6AB|nr:LysR family transcriptional regulator [Cupriavidus sp. USMAHM13]AOZ03617.1 LysR family transcriptional regulator [Cupriavidus sp. USMAHM13]